MYGALAVAKYVVNYCNKKNEPVTNLKLQKLLYYIQGQFYKETGQPAFSDDIVAWKLGPVVLPVYFKYNNYLAKPITKDYDENELPSFSEEEKRIVDKIIEKLSSKSAWELVNMTHDEKPWQETKKDKIIDEDLIKNYFCSACED